MKFYIFGNGFDLSHGLKTKFTDFEHYVYSNNPKNYTCLEEFPYDTSELWGDFENTIAKLDIEMYMAVAGSIFNRKDVPDEELADTRIAEETDFDHLLINYDECKEDISQWLINMKMPKKKFILNKNDLYFTFNYTLLLENVYGINKSNILHIHGDLVNNDLIIGYDNYDLDDAIEEASPFPDKQFPYELDGYCIMTEYFNNFHKNTNEILMKNLNFISKIKYVDEIIVYGVSFSKCDEVYLDSVFSTAGNETLIKIYYYSDDDNKKINNFVKKYDKRFVITRINNEEDIVEL